MPNANLMPKFAELSEQHNCLEFPNFQITKSFFLISCVFFELLIQTNNNLLQLRLPKSLISRPKLS